MTVKYSKYAASLHKDTQAAIENRAKASTNNLSWWMDSALTRYYTMLEASHGKAVGYFTKSEINQLKKAIAGFGAMALRNMNYQGLRHLIKHFHTEKIIDSDVWLKIRQLPANEFLALFEHLEREAYKKDPQAAQVVTKGRSKNKTGSILSSAS